MNIALVKNNSIVNIIVMESNDAELIESFKTTIDFDTYFVVEEYQYPVGVNWTYDSSDNCWKPFYLKKYNSWIFNKNSGGWESPVPEPQDTILPNQYWAWDESNQNWVLLQAPVPPVTGSIPNA